MGNYNWRKLPASAQEQIKKQLGCKEPVPVVKGKYRKKKTGWSEEGNKVDIKKGEPIGEFLTSFKKKGEEK